MHCNLPGMRVDLHFQFYMSAINFRPLSFRVGETSPIPFAMQDNQADLKYRAASANEIIANAFQEVKILSSIEG